MFKLNVKIIRIKKLVELGGIEPPTSCVPRQFYSMPC